MTSSTTSPIPSDSPKVEKANPWAVLFFAALFFLCSADRFFAVRIFDLNFRYGQFLLLACVLPLFWNWVSNPRSFQKNIGPNLIILKHWIPFALFYAIACTLALDPQRSFLKFFWMLFNIGGAALLFLSGRYGKSLLEGVYYGILAIAFTICAQFIILYWPGVLPMASGNTSFRLTVFPNYSDFFLGYVQPSGEFGATKIFRPHAYYYEPSYAGCAMALAYLLSLAYALSQGGFKIKYILASALVLGAAFMTSSRTAIIASSFSLLMVLSAGLWKKNRAIFRGAFSLLLAAVLLLSVLLVSGRARDYLGFVIGPLGFSSVTYRISDSGSSEGWRVANMIQSVKLWKDHPLIGMGVPPIPENKNLPGLGLTSENMWLEIGIESGLLGFLAFIYAIFKTLHTFLWANKNREIVILVSAALTAHFLVSMNLTSTFPRLDYWLLFFFAFRICTEINRDKFLPNHRP
jgi:hypothetical protein